MDFMFGTLSTDELKLYNHRIMCQGVRHEYNIMPRQPSAHEAIHLFATTGVDVSVDAMACYYTTDGSDPVGRRGETTNGNVLRFSIAETRWDSLSWGYITRWKATCPGLPKSTRLRYRISAWSNEGEEWFADYPDLKRSAEHAADRHFSRNLPPDLSIRWGNSQRGTIFTLNIGQPSAPNWAHDAIIYHLMIDRFYPGKSKSWLQTDNLYTFCGGTLQGVHEKIDYIASLGVNCLWLSPLWASPSHHGYDTTNYREVEPRFGDKKGLRKLIDAAHTRGLRVIFDMACNHLSNKHPLFQSALHDSTSSYRNWFTFNDSKVGYDAFFNLKSLPKINLTNPDARDWMIEHALYWLREFDIDGYRLDYANGPRPDFWSYFVSACKSEKTDVFCFGEIVDAPNVLQAYVGRLDGALDFQINYALRQTFGWQRWTIADFERFLTHHQRYMDPNFVMPAFIDNHDMDRFLYIANEKQDAQLSALKALMHLPNPPVIYYGTEVGVRQTNSAAEGGLDVSRTPMRWGDKQDKALLEKVRALIWERRNG